MIACSRTSTTRELRGHITLTETKLDKVGRSCCFEELSTAGANYLDRSLSNAATTAVVVL